MSRPEYSNCISSSEDVGTDKKLHNQFHYFRNETIDAALVAGVTVPLEIINDTGSHIVTFLEQRGPNFLLGIMPANIDNTHLIKCALSLLSVTIARLRLKSHDSSDLDGSGWAEETLQQIAEDSSPIAVCITVLTSCPVQSIKILALQLISQLVTVSREALNQMLESPQKGSKINLATISIASVTEKSSLFNAKEQGYCGASSSLYNIPTIAQHNLEYAAPPSSALVKAMETLSRVSKGVTHYNGKKEKPLKNSSQLSSEDSQLLQGGLQEKDRQSTRLNCVSYMLSVVAITKNQYHVMGAVAEVLLAMIADKSEYICEEIAKVPICLLSQKLSIGLIGSGVGRRVSEGSGTGQNSGRSRFTETILAKTSLPNSEGTIAAIGRGGSMVLGAGTNSGSKPWQGLHVLVDFLKRYRRYFSNDTEDEIDLEINFMNDKQDHDKAVKKTKKIDTLTHSMSNKEKIKLATIHGLVLKVVCELISNSPVVASYVLNIPGAVDNIRLCQIAQLDSNISGIHDSLRKCSNSLRIKFTDKVAKEILQRTNGGHMSLSRSVVLGSPSGRPEAYSPLGFGNKSTEKAMNFNSSGMSTSNTHTFPDVAIESIRPFTAPNVESFEDTDRTVPWTESLHTKGTGFFGRKLYGGIIRPRTSDGSTIRDNLPYSKTPLDVQVWTNDIQDESASPSRPSSPFIEGFYEVPEKPTRRLPQEKKGIDARLKRELFSKLPEVPSIPVRVTNSSTEILSKNYASRVKTQTKLLNTVRQIGTKPDRPNPEFARIRSMNIYSTPSPLPPPSATARFSQSSKLRHSKIDLSAHSNVQPKQLKHGNNPDDSLCPGSPNASVISGLTFDGIGMMERPDIADAYKTNTLGIVEENVRNQPSSVSLRGTPFTPSVMGTQKNHTASLAIESYDIIV